MTAKETIRQALKDLDIYPEGEVNACRIYKDWQGWHIQKFGKISLVVGSSLAEVLENLHALVDERKANL